MKDKDIAPKRAEEAMIHRAAELLGVAIEGLYLQEILAVVVLRLAEKEAARG